MVSLKVGTELKIAKAGQSDKGRWAFGVVNAEKGYDKITVWANNANDVTEGDDCTIKSIVSVRKSAKKYEKDGETKWADTYEVVAELESKLSGFSKIDESEIPF